MSAAEVMTAPDARSNDRMVHYTMKTPRPGSTPHGHSHTNSQSYRTTKSSTPLASPRMPHSVGQAYPPRLSPGAASASRVSTQVQDSRSSSPNYFGLIVEPSTDPRDSTAMPRNNWSSPTSSVKSFAAAIPQQLPLDANPEFEAFRRQADVNRGVAPFSLNSANFGGPVASTPHPTMGSGPAALLRPRPPRWHTHGSDTASESSLSRSIGIASTENKLRGSKDLPARMDVDADSNSLHDSAYVSADSKRNSEASLNPPPFFRDMPRHESPAQFESPFESRTTVSNVEDRHPRLSVMQGKTDLSHPGPVAVKNARADTVPAKLEAGAPTMMNASQLRDILEGPMRASLLLLDIRVATHYGSSHIQSALNLCIPTTLLKRATFNLHKLQLTFQSDEQQEEFAAWRDKAHLVVYDSSSTEKRDAVAALNMLKKFTSEGYKGEACVLRGGFNNFAAAYPHLLGHRSGTRQSASPPLSLDSGAQRRPTIAPVIGGVMLPAADSAPNPFFSNIRQNMDLADGVGQMDVSLPKNLDTSGLPRWLREAASPKDHGKAVSDKFLNIEQTEQARMKMAYSVNPVAGNHQEADNVQLSGIEKGSKNRYKNILPFEHARVRLEGRAEGECDYVNASHIQASRTHKRYIASQGPLPATFEDFWSVIWDQDVRVIVMLTAESEGGQLKCHPYWKANEYGSIKLRSLSEKKVSLDIDKHRSHSNFSGDSSSSNTPSPPSAAASEVGRRRANTTTTLGGSGTPTPPQSSHAGHGETPYVIVRKFALSHAAHPFAPIREITHLHYPSWPDFGAPAQPSHLLALVELANVMQRAALPIDTAHPRGISPSAGNAGAAVAWYEEPESDARARPMLVHCSAGCGRTGTFCTVDSVVDMLKRQRMRAVRRANEAVQRVREAQARAAVRRDSDGDVAMDDAGAADGASTTTLVEPSTPFPRRLSSVGLVGYPARPDDEAAAAAGGGGGSPGEEDAGVDTTWLDDEAVDLVARTVEDFRTQRLSMVQSLRQFVLCYETILEWVWRLQERAGVGTGPGGRGRARSGSLQVRRTDS